MIRSRPKRTVSNNVDYNLRKSKIIREEDNVGKGLRKAKGQIPSMVGQHEHENREGDIENDIKEEESQPVINHKLSGEMVFNEPGISEPVNGVTGIPLSEFPTDRVKKDSLWNVKVDKEIPRDIEARYKQALVTEGKTQEQGSFLRSQVTPNDIHLREREAISSFKRKHSAEFKKNMKQQNISASSNGTSTTSKHKRIKAIKDNDSKLFGQNSTANHAHLPEIRETGNEIENDDFCSSCLQTGIFLCCDTCPKSFHFACLNPPLDPDNLPEGDWSCYECRFKQMNPNKSVMARNEKLFLANNNNMIGKSLFGKLVFQLRSMNSKQFALTQQIKDAFVNVHTGHHGEYQDGNMKEPLTDKQLFNVPYGQSITKFDSYNPDTHLSGIDDQQLLICYKCNMTRMGTWDHPETERLIMRCDYCNTPWHLDCLPVPRASRKNLGSKWRCPLHAMPPNRKRRLNRNQEYISSSLGAPNDGDIEIKLENIPIEANISKDMQKAWNNEKKYNTITQLQEHNVKLEFLDKVYRAKEAQRTHEFHEQSLLIDKLLNSFSNNDTKPWLYFSLPDSMKKIWDFQELCTVASAELTKEEISCDELKQLQLLKKLLESKPRKEVFGFFGFNK
ncbi:Rco1p Ecym_7248 [Eremothecium cymbalariae DBVPG|uniref:PHD-type domain-containing protein n=1 Tax=Eremothecium cymbalariae (strain CBS 270.75 / DBVPG 7215 / KCTC 17166 / NRRL Y-17582) TaxID=931890 RepID=G8JW77_ERECY|nr:hypothetical protein Ecym_7248 [Eremothecium cymbalariae DBVPG\